LAAPTTGFFTENAKKWMARNFFSWPNARLSDSDSQLFTARNTGHCVTIKETLSVPQLRRMYRFLFRIWCFVRQHCVQICNRKERKQLWHKLDLMGSYLANVCSIRFKLAWVRLQNSRRSVVVISQVVHMGDIVACEPIVRYIRQKEPDAFIVWAVERGYRELTESHPEINFTLAVKCITEWIWFADSKLFERVIDLNISGRSCPVCNIQWVSNAGTNGVNYDNYYNQSSLLSAYTRSAGLPQLNDQPKLYLTEAVRSKIDRFKLPDQFIVVHCGANEKSRTLPVNVWKQIQRHINEKHGFPVIEIGLTAGLNDVQGSLYLNLCGRLSILESAEVIRRSLMYVGTDSGPAHLANAVCAYGVIPLGYYHVFRNYTPYSGDYGEGRNCELIRHDGPVGEISVCRILNAIDRRMAKVGCSANQPAVIGKGGPA
jgi:ADP-heptose:LPS heptosyltransferase